MKWVDFENFEEIYEILENSFPLDERRSYDEQKNLLNRKEYFLIGKTKNNNIIGFIALWDFEFFSYIEHFAIKECYRNQGYGEEIIREIEGRCEKKLVLEVELPETEIAKRRIDFYERNGFIYNDFEYVQLPYSKEKKPVPLKIMSYPDGLNEEEFISVRNCIYRELFGVEI